MTTCIIFIGTVFISLFVRPATKQDSLIDEGVNLINDIRCLVDELFFLATQRPSNPAYYIEDCRISKITTCIIFIGTFFISLFARPATKQPPAL